MSTPTTIITTVGIVEDSDEDFAALERILGRAAPGTGLVRWPRAEALLDELDDENHDWPTLLLIDLNLPGIDGAELIKRLRAHPATQGLPLFVLSGSARLRDIERSYSSGASVFLNKPLRRDDLLAILQLTSAVHTTRQKPMG